jgi:hypothetical protein
MDLKSLKISQLKVINYRCPDKEGWAFISLLCNIYLKITPNNNALSSRWEQKAIKSPMKMPSFIRRNCKGRLLGAKAYSS